VKIGTKTTNPGELRTAVTIQTRTATKDSGGHQSATWSDVATVWARWKNAHGSEVWASQAVDARMPATVLIRYRSGVDTTCALLKGSTRYEVVSVDNIDERNEYLELKVQLARAG